MRAFTTLFSRDIPSVVASLLFACATSCITVENLGNRVAGANDGGTVTKPDGSVAPADAKTMFVTSGLYTGNLKKAGGAADGPLSADVLCNREARSAGLAGTYKAWLSTSGESASARIAPVGPWKLTDGSLSFLNPSVVGSPKWSPHYDAKGAQVGVFDVAWTGTSREGVLTKGAETCLDWASDKSADKGSTGDVYDTREWTETDFSPTLLGCDRSARLYCFEQ